MPQCRNCGPRLKPGAPSGPRHTPEGYQAFPHSVFAISRGVLCLFTPQVGYVHTRDGAATARPTCKTPLRDPSKSLTVKSGRVSGGFSRPDLWPGYSSLAAGHLLPKQTPRPDGAASSVPSSDCRLPLTVRR